MRARHRRLCVVLLGVSVAFAVLPVLALLLRPSLFQAEWTSSSLFHGKVRQYHGQFHETAKMASSPTPWATTVRNDWLSRAKKVPRKYISKKPLEEARRVPIEEDPVSKLSRSARHGQSPQWNFSRQLRELEAGPRRPEQSAELTSNWIAKLEDTGSKEFLDHLCRNYTSDLAAGSLCDSLCKAKEFVFEKLLYRHRAKRYVYQAEWKGKPVILKTVYSSRKHNHRIHNQRLPRLQMFKTLEFGGDKPHTTVSNIMPNDSLTTAEFIRQANVTFLYGITGGRTNEATERLLKQVISDCDLHEDGILEHSEIIRCWQIIESEEYVILSLLKESQVVPKVLGICGELFAVEYATPIDADRFLGYHSHLSYLRPWTIIAKLFLAILDLLEALESTPFGPLYHCDVKVGHIGIVTTRGKTVAKLIDLDNAWFGDVARFVKFQTEVFLHKCATNTDCDFFKCHFACDPALHTCTDRLISNNLQVFSHTFLSKLFSDILWKSHTHSYPNAQTLHKLEDIIQNCSHYSRTKSHLPRELVAQLRSVFLESLQAMP